MTKRTIQVLKRARKLIADETRWTKDEQARNLDGEAVEYDSLEAVQWCAVAAIAKTAPTFQARIKACDALAETLGFKASTRIIAWNNAKRRKHTDVLAAFDDTIARGTL